MVKSMFQQFNKWLAMHMTLAAGTVWCFYCFLTLCVLPLMFPAYQNNILYVSNCFQLVLLPIIMVGQNILGEASEKRSIEDHDTIMAEFSEMKDMHGELHSLVQEIHSNTKSE